ncbi:hypothetical protein L1049_016058 [Liquidambar formosana]|uniref:adenylate dimethylallyltransferase (ADP/ATP-dependent) n=1 Tax=Liquidambar formosana TaxID=63359 RepID=A0AAP0RZ34_LIQFO
MRISFSACKQAEPLVNYQGGFNLMGPLLSWRRKDKVVIVMGATGTGKSRLAIDLATRFPAEIVNSDKIQVYEGLDVVTNKVNEEECRGVPHHLLGIVDPNSNFTAMNFRHHASLALESIVDRDRLPIIAGGSNSYIKALVNDDVGFRSKYECCFLWVDVSLPVLRSFVSERVDRMVEAGFVDEVRRIFDPEADYSRGIRKAIGVPELDLFFRCEGLADEKTRARLLEAAIAKIKEHTCDLACSQLQKIHKLKNIRGWNLHRLDATEAFLKRRGKSADEAWQNLVAGPSTMIVKQFLYGEDYLGTIPAKPDTAAVMAAATAAPIPMAAAVAAASH